MSCTSCVIRALRAFDGALFELGLPGLKQLRSPKLRSQRPRAFHSAPACLFGSSPRNYNESLYLGNEAPSGTVDDVFLPFTDARRGMQQPSKESGLRDAGILRASWSRGPSGQTGKDEELDLGRFDREYLDPQISLLGPSTTQNRQRNQKSNLYSSIGLTDVNSLRADRGELVEKHRARYSIRKEGLPHFTRNPATVKEAPGDGYKRENWQIQKQSLAKKFGQTGWAPRKKLSPDTLEGIRALHAQYPDKYTTSVLAQQFEVSPEAIRRILKSKWKPTETEVASRRQRWDKRGELIWSRLAESGVKPPRKWRRKGIGRDQIPLHKQRRREDSQNRPVSALRPNASDASSAAGTSLSLSGRIL